MKTFDHGQKVWTWERPHGTRWMPGTYERGSDSNVPFHHTIRSEWGQCRNYADYEVITEDEYTAMLLAS